MKNFLLFVCFPVFWIINTHAQTSGLVYPGQDGNLTYEKFANHGEDTLVNIIPDFSNAGYMGGGVPLPEDVPVKITVESTGTENDLVRIQNAVNQVSAMPLDENGFRGAVLLKAGLFKLNGPLFISASGVVLRGEEQLPASLGGTELLATAAYKHSFINIKGDEVLEEDSELDLGTELASFDYPAENVWVRSDVMEGVSSELEDDSVITFVFYSVQSGNYKFYSKENGDMSRTSYVEIIAYDSSKSSDDTLKIYPTDDTYVRGVEEDRDKNFGDATTVYYKLVTQGARIGFSKFDLREIPGPVKSATLNIMASREDQSGVNYIAYTKDDDWSEDTRTWNTTFDDIENVQRITSDYVGTGARSFVIEDASGYKTGDKIMVRRTPNQLWCDTLEMSTLSQRDPECTDWTPESYTIEHARTITAINGDTIIIDIPVVDPMQKLYGGGEILRNISSFTVNNSAVENMVISSVYKSEEDEDHGWDAIKTNDIENCWVRNVTARYFGYSCVNLGSKTNFCTIQDCALLDPKSITTGGRKYPFPIGGGIGNLVQRCYTRGGRHSFATHSRVTGPHVFLDCYATENYADIGPHHRWAAGVLFDNVYGGQIRVQNRWTSGTGHGWAGVQNMFWNCYSEDEDFKVESPLGGLNWGIGCIAQKRGGDGFWESYGNHVEPRSLYLQQLKDRLGEQAVINVSTADQRAGNIWDQMADWAGNDPTGIEETRGTGNSSAIRVYPSPAKDYIFADLRKLPLSPVNCRIYDLWGRCLHEEIITGNKITRLSIPGNISNELILIKFSGKNLLIVKKISVY